MKIFKIIILIIFTVNLSSCRWFSGSGAPFLAGTRINTPPGTPKFKKGFEDGCGTVIYARGNVLYRNLYKHNFDPKLIDDSEYSFGYKRGYSYCFQYMIGPTGQVGGGADTYLWRRDPSSFSQGMGKGNIDNTVNYGALNWWAPGSLDGVIDQTENSSSGLGGVFTSYPTWGTPSTGQIFGQ
jgi:hypothetical protein